MNTQAPELVSLYREDADGEDQLAGWAMVFPETEKVVAYIPGTGVGTELLNAFSSMRCATLILSHTDIYPAPGWPKLSGGPR